MKRLACLAAVAAGTCFGLGPVISPAEAATFSLNLSAPQTAAVGQPVVIHANGTAAPPSEWWNPSWISAVVLDASVIPTCPASAYDASGMASGAGGRILGIALPPNVDQAGNFSNLLAFTPGGPGTALLCAYMDDGGGITLARATSSVTVQGAPSAPSAPAGPAPAAKPANVSKPAGQALGEEARVQARPLVGRQRRLRLRLARGRQAAERSHRAHAQGHAGNARAQGALQRDGDERSGSCHCSQPGGAGPMRTPLFLLMDAVAPSRPRTQQREPRPHRSRRGSRRVGRALIELFTLDR